MVTKILANLHWLALGLTFKYSRVIDRDFIAQFHNLLVCPKSRWPYCESKLIWP